MATRLHLMLALVLLLPNDGSTDTILVEAESFRDRGGWLVDQQWMDQMGSPYLLAHGLGRPVEDAVTQIRVAKPGLYRVFVRTKDWVAQWHADGLPGRFQILVDGKPIKETFGTRGANWFWQDGGTVAIDKTRVTVALHDLTGFEGRCDAIVLTSEDTPPPNDAAAMADFRRRHLGFTHEPEDAGRFDLVVVGGGIAGTCAALSAARLGLSVALVQDRPVLGGNNSSEVRVWLQGARNKPPYPRVGDIVAELEQARSAHYGPTNTADLYEDQKKLDLVRAEKNITLLLEHRVNLAKMAAGRDDSQRIAAVIAQHTISGRRLRLCGRWFVDSTGDGCLGFLAGADHDVTIDGHMGRCNLWNVIETDQPVAFPRCPWALDLSDKPFPGRAKKLAGVGADRRGIEALGGWYWESGFYHDPIARGEAIRDWNFRAMYGAWDALKNVDQVYPNHRLNWAAHVSGKRESRRLLGDIVLTKEDVIGGKKYADGCVPTGWPIDLHLPDPRYEKGFEGNAFIAKAHYTRYEPPYWIPYRCLYSRNVANLLMAGRDISVTHEALGTVRVMRTGGCMGEIVGMAASLCQKHDTDPRGVYLKHLRELKQLMSRGVGKPPVPLLPPKGFGENLAPRATLETSGSRDRRLHPPKLLHDGRADMRDNAGRWLSTDSAPSWVEFRWPRPQSIAGVRVLSGYRVGNTIIAPLNDYVLQYYDRGAWKDIAGTAVTGNRLPDRSQRFKPLTADRLRLLITKTQDNVSRLWEVGLHAP